MYVVSILDTPNSRHSGQPIPIEDKIGLQVNSSSHDLLKDVDDLGSRLLSFICSDYKLKHWTNRGRPLR